MYKRQLFCNWRSISVTCLLALISLNSHAQDSCLGGSSARLETTNGFVFEFSQSHRCGQYLDGTYWIEAPNGATLVASSPAYSNGRNGMLVNMTVAQRPYNVGLDNRICGAINSSRCAFTAPQLPMSLSPGDSMLKVESVTTAGANSDPMFEKATVLTVLSSAPVCSKPLRPPYAGTEKPQYCFDSVDVSSRLPSLPPISGQNGYDTAFGVSLFGDVGNGGVWLSGCTDASLRVGVCFSKSSQNGMNGNQISSTTPGYGTARSNSITTAIALSIQTGSAVEKEKLAWRIAQVGIDNWGLVRAGKTFYADGGIHNGRKLPILLASHLLEAPELRNVFGGAGSNKFQEDGMIYRDGGTVFWGRSPCMSAGGGSNRQNRVCGANHDGGRCATSQGYSCGNNDPQPSLAGQLASGSSYTLSSYQQHTHNYFGMAAIIRQLGLESEWNNDQFLEYTDRMSSPPWNRRCVSWCMPFLSDFHKAYGGEGSFTPTNSPVKPNGPPGFLVE